MGSVTMGHAKTRKRVEMAKKHTGIQKTLTRSKVVLRAATEDLKQGKGQ